MQKNDKIAVALSGNSSAAMLFLLKQIKGIEVFAITIDEEKKKTAYAKKIAKSFGIQHHVFKNRWKAKKEVFRRWLLNKKARELGAAKLAVGHSMDDECASIILSMARGDFSRFQRLGTNPIVVKNRKFVPRIKPMMFFSEKEIDGYAKKNKIPVLKEKSSGHREEAKKLIDNMEKKHPGTKYQIVKFYEKIRPFLIKDAFPKIYECMKCGEPASRRICRVCELKN